MKKPALLSAISLGALVLLAPLSAFAHEVYVLTPDEIQRDMAMPAFSMLQVIRADLHLFAFWTFVSILIVIGVFLISISRKLERWLDPMFLKLKPYAPVVSRVTIGIAFIAAAWNQAAYGPELPLIGAWGAYTPTVTGVLVVIGLCAITGLLTRTAAVITLALYAVNVYLHGFYMLTYANYFGEIVVLLVLGAHAYGLDLMGKRRRLSPALARLQKKLEPLAFPFLRVCFGISLLYASVYAKILHNNLALDIATGTGFRSTVTVHAVSLAATLGFEPHFLVVGAAIVEVVIALFFILGIEIRFTAIFLEFWLTLSLLYFGEVVWPHFILIGIPIAFIFYGYDKYSLEGRFFKKGAREPVL